MGIQRLEAKPNVSFPSNTAFCLLACVGLVCTSCVVHSYDKKTGTERLWGFGYMRMRVSSREFSELPQPLVSILCSYDFMAGQAKCAGEQLPNVGFVVDREYSCHLQNLSERPWQCSLSQTLVARDNCGNEQLPSSLTRRQLQFHKQPLLRFESTHCFVSAVTACCR